MNDADRIFLVLGEAFDLIFKEQNLPDIKEQDEEPKEEIKEDVEG